MKTAPGIARKVLERKREVVWRGDRRGGSQGTHHRVELVLECGHRLVLAFPVGRRMGGDAVPSDESLSRNKAATRAYLQDLVACIACGP